MEDEFYNLTSKGNDLKTYFRRFLELAALCPNIVPIFEKLMEVFIGGLPQSNKAQFCARKQWTLHWQVSDLQQGRSPDREQQKQRASHKKQLTTSISDLSCLWVERALQKSVPKSKQHCPWESIHAEGQECSPRPERSHAYVASKPTSS
ncbi:hypothetical protein Tco_0605833 [Tanacetum coccineum]